MDPNQGAEMSVSNLTSSEVDAIQTDQFLIGYHMVFLGILCTLSIILVLFSTRRQRRSYLLALQVFALSIVIAAEVMLTINMYKDISNIINHRSPDDPQVVNLNKLGVAIDTFSIFAPLAADTVLLYRVHDFQSKSMKPQLLQRYRHVIPLVLILIVRLGLDGASVYKDWSISTKDYDRAAFQDLYKSWLRLRLVEWVLQIIYCAYAFTVIMRQIIRLTRRSSLLRHTSSIKMRSRLRFLIEAVLMTFFIPLVFQLGALVTMSIMYNDPSSQSSQKVSHIWTRFTQLNYLFSVIFCILATSWSTIRENGSTALSRNSKDSSLDHIVEMQQLPSKAADSVEDVGDRARERERRQRTTLIERLFSTPSDEREEEVEELRTTQFVASEPGTRTEARPSKPATPGLEENRRR